MVATNYFTKLVEAKSYCNVSEGDVIQFLKEMIIYCFGLPQTITFDNGLEISLGQEYKLLLKNIGLKSYF